MFYADEDKAKLCHVMSEAGLKEARFCFDFQGTVVLKGWDKAETSNAEHRRNAMEASRSAFRVGC